jgi:Tfp pilus assembly protein PilN
MFKRTFTLYIEDAYIAVVVTWGRRVKRFATMPLPPGTVKEGVVLDAPLFSRTLKQFLKTAKIRRSKVTVCFSGARSFMRLVLLPDLPTKLMTNAVAQEAEKLMPVPLESLYLAWSEIGRLDDKKQVFLLGIPRPVWDSAIPVLRSLHLEPSHIDIKPLALAWAAGLADSLICDVQADSADFVIVRAGVPHIMRTVSLPLSDSAEEMAQNVAEELEKTLALFHSTYPDRSLLDDVPIYLSGKVSQDKLLELLILRETGRRGVPFPLTGLPDIPWQQYIVNLGLLRKEGVLGAPCKKGMHRGLAKLNLLPLPYQPSRRSRQRLAYIGVAVVAVAGLMPLFSLVNASAAEVDSLQSRLALTNQVVQNKQLEQKAIARLEQSIAEVSVPNEKMNALLTQITSNRQAIRSDLSRIMVDSLPATVSLTYLEYDGNTIEVRGIAESKEAFLGYGRMLRDSQDFSSVAVASLQDTTDGVDFTLVIVDEGIMAISGAK